ncbi:MAG TPA: outer membrane lipid asymmetry maintenance protein MlaD [Methylomirabilota bacterium]|jgi:phospholipid/cholesterol/gamma-HCH transport system substrate-binding protein|nr:outer membrane lipid asymmetry maintenance protein MlaD [Methylomirabilota bacterium]
MRRSVIETIMGAVVLVVAGLFLFFAYTSSNVQATGGYELVARFNRVDGLANGSDVRMSGIKVGSVVAQSLDPKTYRAIVRLSIDSAIKLPEDTTARIQSDGLLGNTYMVLEPGGAEEMIPPGGTIAYTQDAVNLVDLLGRFIFSTPASGSSGGGTGAGATPPAPQPQPEAQPAQPQATDGQAAPTVLQQ